MVPAIPPMATPTAHARTPDSISATGAAAAATTPEASPPPSLHVLGHDKAFFDVGAALHKVPRSPCTIAPAFA